MKIVQQIYWKYSSNTVTNNEFAGNIFLSKCHFVSPVSPTQVSTPLSSLQYKNSTGRGGSQGRGDEEKIVAEGGIFPWGGGGVK